MYTLQITTSDKAIYDALCGLVSDGGIESDVIEGLEMHSLYTVPTDIRDEKGKYIGFNIEYDTDRDDEDV